MNDAYTVCSSRGKGEAYTCHEPQWWVHNRDRHMFFAKTLIERTRKSHLGKHSPTQNNPLVAICNEYWSTSKYQV